MDTSEWLTTPQAEKAADLDKGYIARLCREGKIEGQRVGRDWIVSRASLLAYLRKWDANAQLKETEEESTGNG